MNRKWVLKKIDEQAVDHLHEELNINRTLCKLLVQRGVLNYEDAKKFFRPSLETHLHDPFLMKDMDRAIERIDRAMNNKEKILVYGDYDVDGTTAVTVVYGFLKDLYFYVDYYLPDRYLEGYGVSTQGIDWAYANGFSLIIALDCGIKSVDKVEYAQTLGIDFIICDHHRPDAVLPPAYAVLDPKRRDCPYPFKELSGCGIGFKLLSALAQTKGIPFTRVAKLLDLVAVSIAADIVPINDENRVLAHFGLKRLNHNPRPGLRSLIELNSLNRHLTISDIVFSIAPRINAAGRMDDAKQAVRLLMSQEGNTARKRAADLQLHNNQRKQIDSGITEEALLLLENSTPNPNQRTTVLYQPHWHKGVIGIVASRLIEKYHRPTIVLTLSNGLVSGSARSIAGYDIYNAIKACSDLLEQFGGHRYAAGLTMLEENVPEFIKRFEKVVSETIEDSMLKPEIHIDTEINLSDITPKFYSILKQFAPFGPANMKPVFLARNVTDAGWSSVVGNNHLRLMIRQGTSNVIKGIGYNMGGFIDAVKAGEAFDVCFSIEENNYNNSNALQINIRDIQPAGMDIETTKMVEEEENYDT